MSNPRLSTSAAWLVALGLLLEVPAAQSARVPAPPASTEQVQPGARDRPAPGQDLDLACGESVVGRIDRAGAQRTFRLRARAGVPLDLTLVAPEPPELARPRAMLLGPQGEVLLRWTGTGLRSFVPRRSGTHRLVVSAEGPTAFRLGLGCVADDGSLLLGGESRSARLEDPGEVHHYHFPGWAGDTVQLALASLEGFEGAAPRATLFGPDGESLGTVEGGGVLSREVPVMGTYTVRLRSNTLQEGGVYGIELNYAPPVGQATPLLVGEVFEEIIIQGGNLEWFTFDGDVDETIEVAFVRTSGFQGGLPRIDVFAPSGTPLGSYSADTLETLHLEETGTYAILASTGGASTVGSVSLGVSVRPDAQAPATLGCGGAVVGSLAQAAEVTYETFDATVGDVAQLTLQALSGFLASQPQMAIVSPSGAELMDLGSFEARGGVAHPIVIQESGRHVVRILSSTLLDAGQYQLALGCPGPSTTVHLGGDSVHQGTVASAGEMDGFLFDGEPGEVVELTLVRESGFAGTNPSLTLIAPSGTPTVLGASSAAVHTVTLLESGRHQLTVVAQDGLGTGTYSLGLERRLPASPLPKPLAPGQVYVGAIDRAAEADYFSFAGSAGTVVELTLVKEGGFFGTQARAVVLSPSDAVVVSLQSRGSTRITLAETGSYRVRVDAADLLGTGSYHLGLFHLLPTAPVTSQLVAGDLLDGDIERVGKLEYHTFAGFSGETVELTLVKLAGFFGSNVDLSVWSPSGVYIDLLRGNQSRSFNLTETGTYVLRVSATNLKATGDYRVGFFRRSPNPAPLVSSLVSGDQVADAIDRAGELEYYTFDGTVGETVDLTLVKTSGFGGTNVSASVWSPSDAYLGGILANSLVSYTLAESGTYVVRVQAQNLVGTGGYTLGYWLRQPVPGTLVQALTSGDQVSSSIDGAGELEYYTFDGSSGETVDLTLVKTSGFASTNVSFLVWSPSGSYLGGAIANTSSSYTLTESGTYVVRVNSQYLVETGSYSLGFWVRQPVPGTLVQALTSGVQVASSIDSGGELEYYTFDGSPGETVDLTLVKTGGFASTNVSVLVWSPSGSYLGGAIANTSPSYTLTESGTYVVRVNSQFLVETGSYSLGFWVRQPVPGTLVQALTSGVQVASSIDSGGELEYYTFDGSPGETVDLTLVKTGGFASTNVSVLVWSPSGSYLGGSIANTSPSYTLTESGTYVVRVNSQFLVETGSYSLGFWVRQPVPGTLVQALTSGDQVPSSIDGAGELEYYTFDGTVGETVDLTLVQTSGFASTRAVAAVWSPSGAVLGTFSSNAVRSYALAESGTYVVRVGAQNLVATGSYSLGLWKWPPAGASSLLVCGSNEVRSIAQPGELAYFTFDASAGGSVQLTLAAISGFSGSAPVGAVWAPSGTFLGSLSEGVPLSPSLTENGTYLVRVQTQNLVATGTYSLQLACP